MGKNTGKVREFCQSGKVGTLIMEHVNPLGGHLLFKASTFEETKCVY